MESLNKYQIVLLCLLMSFVTSIATGIMTVSLLQEAPVEVTRNINQIVERTIETVVPASLNSNAPQKIQTVVVKEEDQVVNSINKNAKSIIRIRERNPFTDEKFFYGIGIVVSKDGIIVADRKEVLATNVYTGTLSDGATMQLIPQGIDKQTNFIAFKVDPEDLQKISLTPATFSEAEPQLGQTFISLGGEVSNSISVGRTISLITKEKEVGTSTTKYISGINTDVSSKDIVDGSPLLNLSGDIAGIKLLNDDLKTFTVVSILRKELPELISVPMQDLKKQQI